VHGHAFEPARSLERVGHLLLPWICVLMLSSTIAYAVDEALVETWHESPPHPPATAMAAARPGLKWIIVMVSWADGPKSTLDCLTSTDRITTNVISVDAEELNTVVSELWSELWAG
jgi:hypothetical protein